MDFRQLSTQIDTQPAGGELKASGDGDALGSPSREGGFSTVLHAVSQETEGSRGTQPRASQAETDDRPSTATQAVHRAVSRKVDGRTDADPRDPQAETDDKPSSTAPVVHRAVSRKADGSTDADPRDPQAKSDDGSSTPTSDILVTVSHETSSSTDTESRAAQSATSDTPSTTTSGSDPLLLSLLGATMVTSSPMVTSTQKAANTDASTTHVDGLSGISGTSMIQPIALPAEGIASPVRSETGLSDLAGHKTTSATGDAVAALSSPMPEQQPLSAVTDTVIPVVGKSDISGPLTARQGQEAQSRDPHQGIPIMEHPEKGVSQTMVPSGQVAANGQDPAQPTATVTTQPTCQNGEGVAAQPDRSPAQQILGKAEPSLHQKNMPAEFSETQTASALSGQTSTEGQSFNTESDGQRKEDGLKWFSHADLQSVEVASRQPQQSVAVPLDSGRQYPLFQQGQGGTPSSIQSAPPSSQANPLSPGPETPHVPVTHAVQFDLAPSDFGQLRVRVVLSDQTVHTHLSTNRAELGQMLTSQQEQLSTQLSGAGLDLGRFQVQVNQERTNHSGQEWSSQAHGGTSQQQRDSQPHSRSQDAPVPSQKRVGMLSLFA